VRVIMLNLMDFLVFVCIFIHLFSPFSLKE